MRIQLQPHRRHKDAFRPLARWRLQTQLATLSASQGVIVLSAPSGFGKTTLLVQYVMTLDGPGLFVDLPQTGGVADMVRAFAAALGLAEFVGLSAIVAGAENPHVNGLRCGGLRTE